MIDSSSSPSVVSCCAVTSGKCSKRKKYLIQIEYSKLFSFYLGTVHYLLQGIGGGWVRKGRALEFNDPAKWGLEIIDDFEFYVSEPSQGWNYTGGSERNWAY